MSTSPKNIGITGTGGMHRLTVADNAVTDAPALDSLCESVFLDVQGGNVYVSFDTTDPSSSHGHILYDTKDYMLYAGMLKSAKFKSVSGSTTVQITELNGYA
jgi:hypothetical protein